MCKDDDDDVELHEGRHRHGGALSNGEEDLTVAVVVHALQDEVLSNGDEEVLATAGEVKVEGLRPEGLAGAGADRRCSPEGALLEDTPF